MYYLVLGSLYLKYYPYAILALAALQLLAVVARFRSVLELLPPDSAAEVRHDRNGGSSAAYCIVMPRSAILALKLWYSPLHSRSESARL